ncbi:response regulator [Rubinisphaera margarita]|uniref:response regulator n=1 Tax=Rubinisphaera margarita TaxID=2909586 RepID=UPI001EE9AE45|nr:response regulator [Rubinisphaera margarita]MCG6156455.1 response regulator [Rubinisphaera margarita]
MSEGIASLLVLEDNDEDFEVLSLACQRYGKPVRTLRFRRAEPLLELIERKTLAPPALAMLDLRLPGASGLSVLERLKKSPHYASVPAVVFTTSSSPSEIIQCYDASANAFHAKVIETETMIRMLVSVLTYWLSDVIHCPMTRRSRHE